MQKKGELTENSGRLPSSLPAPTVSSRSGFVLLEFTLPGHHDGSHLSSSFMVPSLFYATHLCWRWGLAVVFMLHRQPGINSRLSRLIVKYTGFKQDIKIWIVRHQIWALEPSDDGPSWKNGVFSRRGLHHCLPRLLSEFLHLRQHGCFFSEKDL